ncbi:CDP-alcohol phosphatidyltransferase family protein [Oharaeibacter diazotrophicus]|uniref:CDP-diacylglycerol--glycerol-3-phosphate 3-phosphatidyltransferase n=1 Tax=Oharaeibacter diazotrophicus TaxID=1920512 RepID=A0A4R6RKJ4_9HYPH|nr:CDP-alcohol phosphatidyltransferase family protein [Oharaeibacter diazotrophicus]TDP86625.1 CDP-diacylglycerol--glycerol-3-phosphate 3-phosphatidyltransferase [Oharaeibacter diazotrophicus]BBE71433.1 inner membrane protein YnbA [Pleomorphomonas sp. SM30]GLS78193.1 CDP-alcohol phosphatidyltransferase [Oharaeibacter diazotrophicus]
MTLYSLKPRFQALLRPLVRRLAAAGVTANQITLAACAGSLALGVALAAAPLPAAAFLAVPVWLFVRMALNAVDGMLAREFGQQSRLGAYLNELCDVVADAALALPFAVLPGFGALPVAVAVVSALVSEYAGVMAPMVGTARRYDGPFGKSDRALAFGALAAWVGLGLPQPDWIWWAMPAMAVLSVVTTVNRVRAGLAAPARSS